MPHLTHTQMDEELATQVARERQNCKECTALPKSQLENWGTKKILSTRPEGSTPAKVSKASSDQVKVTPLQPDTVTTTKANAKYVQKGKKSTDASEMVKKKTQQVVNTLTVVPSKTKKPKKNWGARPGKKERSKSKQQIEDESRRFKEVPYFAIIYLK